MMMSMQRNYMNQYASPATSSTANGSASLAREAKPLCPPQQQQQSQQQQQQQLEQLEDLKDVLSVLLQQETKYQARIATSTSKSNKSNNSFRPIMMQWMYSVVDIFSLVPQVVPTAMYYMDATIDTLLESPEDYQLLGLACLELGIKIHDTKMFPMQDLVNLGHSASSGTTSTATVQDLIQMEQKLMQELHFQLHPPTAYCFLYQYAQLITKHTNTKNPAQSTSHPLILKALPKIRQGLLFQLQEPPSIIAYAALLVAMEEDSTLLSQHAKQQLCQDVCTISGLSAKTPGLAACYQALASRSSTKKTSISGTNWTTLQQSQMSQQPQSQATPTMNTIKTHLSGYLQLSPSTAATSPASTWCASPAHSMASTASSSNYSLQQHWLAAASSFSPCGSSQVSYATAQASMASPASSSVGASSYYASPLTTDSTTSRTTAQHYQYPYQQHAHVQPQQQYNPHYYSQQPQQQQQPQYNTTQHTHQNQQALPPSKDTMVYSATGGTNLGFEVTMLEFDRMSLGGNGGATTAPNN